MSSKTKCEHCGHMPAGIWAPIVAIALVIAMAALSADIISTAVPTITEAPSCAI